MSAVDDMLSGDEPEVERWIRDFGPFQAQLLVDSFNNGCSQVAGFELAVYELQRSNKTCFLAPLNAMSSQEH